MEEPVVKSMVKNIPALFAPKAALREGSPAILAHLQDGCPTCSAGLRLFSDPGLGSRGYRAAVVRFEKGLAAGLERSANPVLALHTALEQVGG